MSKKNFSPLIPNDAKDFLIFFIGRLHEELNEVDRATYDVVPEKDPLSNFISYFTKNYNSIISNLFNWTNQIKRKCSGCKSQIFSYQTFPYLILDLEKTRKKIFYSEMDKYHKSKLVDNNWRDEYYHNKENIPINLIDCVAYYCSYENQFNFL
jgi:ubiquitin C-terminal hydrolase